MYFRPPVARSAPQLGTSGSLVVAFLPPTQLFLELTPSPEVASISRSLVCKPPTRFRRKLMSSDYDGSSHITCSGVPLFVRLEAQQ